MSTETQRTRELNIGDKYTSGDTTTQYIESSLGNQSISVRTWSNPKEIEIGGTLAKDIVLRYNNHQGLLDALKGMYEAAKNRWRPLPATSHEKKCLNAALAAISAAEEKQ